LSSIAFDSVSFHYSDPFVPVFQNLSLTLDVSWRAGVAARNGRGKTTLLRLILGELTPKAGRVSVGARPFLLAEGPDDPTLSVRRAVKQSVAPFEEWEARMEALLGADDADSLRDYGDLLEGFERAGGYEIGAAIERELDALDLGPETWERPFASLSGGERTRAMIAALFLKRGGYPLLDEPTNHLDMAGRERLGRYLANKPGFLLVSHDRRLLDLCANHILSINKADVRATRGNFSQWRENMELEEEFERRRQENLRREASALEAAAKRRRTWADQREREKIGAYDKGFVGARSARQMKRALATERRLQQNLNEAKSLLANAEKKRSLKLEAAQGSPDILLSVHNAGLHIGGRELLRGVSLAVERGERVAIIGPNGCGKTSLVRALQGELPLTEGTVSIPARLRIAHSSQEPLFATGSLRERLRALGADETAFRNVMAAFGVEGEVFDRPLETFSRGQLKKVDLCFSFLEPADLLLWDEPLNWLDYASREQLEEVLLESQPTMLFVEHDRWFVERVATRILDLGEFAPAESIPMKRFA
jgi:lincosamide and streptogramin A transport system ATP-binding/permease protein